MREAGFTLVEVLAALVVFSVAIIGLSRAGTQSALHTQRLTQKTYAGVVADNALIRTRLAPAKIGAQSGEEIAGGRAYQYVVTTAPTEQDGFFQLNVAVSSKQNGDLLLTRTAFLQAER